MSASYSQGDKYEICFVRTGSSAEEATDNMKSAFEAMDSHQLDPTWITTEECLKLSKKEPKLFIVDPFEGDAFEHLKSIECRIVGPLSILYCLQYSDGLPKRPHPVYSVSMRKITVACSNIDNKRREDICNKVQLMGGFFSKDLTKSVTHLVAGEVGSKKYQVAANFGLPIMIPEWIEDVWKNGQYQQLHATDSCYDKYKCPVFKGLEVSVSQLSAEERAAIKAVVEDNGGSYSGALKAHETTHLILTEPSGDKYRYAKSWKVFCVTVSWIYDSIEAGYCKDETLYALDESLHTQPKRSTPKKDAPCELPLVDCSAIVSNCFTTHLDETTRSNTSISLQSKKNSSFVSLDEFNLSSLPKYGQFLDGCKIFLSGFSPSRVDKLRKIVNSGGGMRFSKYSDSISHVVCGDITDDLLHSVRLSSVKPYVVNYNWLIECCKQKKLVDEKAFLCVDVTPLSPEKSEQESKKEIPNHSCNSQSKKEDVDVVDDNISDILKQYIGECPADSKTIQSDSKSSISDHILNENKRADYNKENVTLIRTEETDVDIPELVEEEETGVAELFAGLTFVVVGFAEKDCEILSGMIETHSGTVRKVDESSACHIAIVPIIWNDINLRVPNIVTNCWLQKCIEDCRIYEFDENELFKPFPALTSKPFDSFVISVSQYSGTERDCLMHLAELLGATCQEYFVRKANKSKGVLANTHLVVSTPDGSKYEAAKKWKIPAVIKQWVLDAARSGVAPPIDNYLVNVVSAKCPNESRTDPTNSVDKPQRPKLSAVHPVEVTAECQNLSVSGNEKNDQCNPEVQTDKINCIPLELTPPSHLSTKEEKRKSLKEMSTPKPKTDNSMNESLNSDQQQGYKFHVSSLLQDLDTSSIHESFRDSKRQSMPLEEMFGRNLNSALKFISNNRIETPKTCDRSIKRQTFMKTGAIAENAAVSGILSGVVLCVAQKLANLQTELNEITASLGGDYIWSYDSSCTHFIFVGKLNDMSKEFRDAKAQGKKIVAPDWIYACKEKNVRVEEELYPHTLKSNMTLSDQISIQKVPASVNDAPAKEVTAGAISQLSKGTVQSNNAVDFNKQLNELLVAAKSAKKRQSKRMANSISSSPVSEISPVQKIQKQFSDAYIKAISTNNNQATEDQDTCSQHSQSYPITWDDPTGRLEREKIAAKRSLEAKEKNNGAASVDENEKDNTSKNPPRAAGSDCEIVEVLQIKDIPSKTKLRKFMFTNIPESEKTEYIKIIKDLGGEVSEEKAFDITATHLIVSNPIKNEKLLSSLASGKWVLHPQYLQVSAEQKTFVAEEDFEWGGPSTDLFAQCLPSNVKKIANCPFRWRMKLNDSGQSCGAFQDWTIVVFGDDKVKLANYTKILESGGAKIIPSHIADSNLDTISHVFVDVKRKSSFKIDLSTFTAHDIKCVKPEYLAVYLIEDPPPDVDNFILPELKEMNCSEPFSRRRNLSTASTRSNKRTRMK